MKKKDAYRESSDSELVAAVKEGDELAFDALFLRWHPQVRKFLTLLLQDPVLAEDLAQAVFIKVWIYRDRLDPAKSLKNYLFVLSKNGALDVFKSKRFLTTDIKDAPIEKAGGDRAEYRMEYGEAYSRIVRAVEEMPDQRKQIFKMSRFQSMPNERIASELGLSVRTVEKHIQLALKDIRKYLS